MREWAPTSVAVDPSSKFAYVVNRGDNTLSMYVINSSTGDLTANGTIATGTEPFAVVVDPSGKFAYVTNESGSVSIYTQWQWHADRRRHGHGGKRLHIDGCDRGQVGTSRGLSATLAHPSTQARKAP